MTFNFFVEISQRELIKAKSRIVKRKKIIRNMSSTSAVITENQKQQAEATLRMSTADQPKSCGKCDKKFKAKDKCIRCATCKLNFHIKCQGVSEQNYEFLKEDENILWLCNSCKQTTRGMVKNLSNVERRVTALEVQMDSKADKEDLQKLDERVTSLEQNGVTAVDKDTEDLSKRLEAALKEQEEIIKKNKAKEEASMTEAVKEVEERERRKGNIIIHNVTESNSDDSPTMKNDDIQKVKVLCEKYLKINIDIRKDQNQQPLVIRLGKKDEKKNRSLKLCLTPEDAQKMLQNAKNLVQVQDPEFKKMIIKPDLTKMQRDEEKKLVELKNQKNQEAKEKNEPEDWIIQRWQVVRRKKPRVPPKADAKTSTGSLNEEYTDAAAGSN